MAYMVATILPSAGGLVICHLPVDRDAVNVKRGGRFGFTLMSDLHVGAWNVDYDLIAEELATARRLGDRILLNGDIFDLILPSDHKRFSPDVLHPRLQGRKNIVNGQLDWAEEILAPVADIVDVIGVGNHDAAGEKHHSIDLIGELIKRLRHHHDRRHVIHHGGYTGFANYRFMVEGDLDVSRFVIYYHHGSGADAPITGGMIDLMRKGWVDADVIWHGHKHTRIVRSIQSLGCPASGWEPEVSDVKQIITGAYFDTYRGQTQEDLTTLGRRSNYAAEKGLAPQGKGGMRLEIEFTSSSNWRVRVIQ